MKRLLFFYCLCVMWSCTYFESKKVTVDDILEDELQTFSWSEVDEYPTFEVCDSLTSKTDKKHCFETTLLQVLKTNLTVQGIVVEEDVSDTVLLKINISKSGVFTVKNIKSKPKTRQLIPDLDSLLLSSLDTLPKLYPAIKRSQQVTTEFTLPVVIKID